MIDSQPGRFCILRKIGPDMRKRAVAPCVAVADILVQDEVQSRNNKETVGQLAVVRREHAQAVLKYVRPIQVGTQGGFDLEHAQSEVLALETDEIAVFAVEDLGLHWLLQRSQQIGLF